MQQAADGTYHMSRIDLIRLVRGCTALGLKEAKDRVDDYLFMGELTHEQREAIYTVQRIIADDPYPTYMKGIIKRKFEME